MQSAEQMKAQELQTQVQIADADREDRQAFRLVEINAQADADIRVQAASAGNKIIENEHTFRNNDLNENL